MTSVTKELQLICQSLEGSNALWLLYCDQIILLGGRSTHV